MRRHSSTHESAHYAMMTEVKTTSRQSVNFSTRRVTNECADWLSDHHSKHKWDFRKVSEGVAYFYFDNPDDAFAFKMRWG